MRNLTIEEVRQRGLEKGFYLNSDICPNSKTPLEWSCKSYWHVFPATFNSIDKGNGCPDCYDEVRYQNRLITIEEVRQRGLQKGYYLISEVYLNSSTKLNWSCRAEGHLFPATWNSIAQDHGCPTCEDTKRTLVEVRTVGLEKGHYLNSTTYVNNKTHLNWSCKAEWHPFPASFANIRQGYGCPTCALKRNKWEDSFYRQLLRFIPHLEQRVKGLLKNKRFHADIWCKNNRRALELDGDYWHDLPNVMESDIRKNQEYSDAGIEVLRIRYSEWEKDPAGAYRKALAFFTL